jgi:hypothetical protein
MRFLRVSAFTAAFATVLSGCSVQTSGPETGTVGLNWQLSSEPQGVMP